MCWIYQATQQQLLKLHLSLYFSDDDDGGSLYQFFKLSSSLYLYLSFYLSLYFSDDDGGGGSLYQAIPLQPFCHQLIKLRTVEAHHSFSFCTTSD